MKDNVKLIKPMYPCQSVPVVVFKNRCPKPCLYCDLHKRNFPAEKIIAAGSEKVLNKLKNFKGAYFSAVSDCFLTNNKKLTHYLIENIWKTKKNFVPLIVTKQIIPKKTMDLFIKNKDRAVVQVSIPSVDDKLISILEPGAAPISERLKMIKEFTKKGVAVIAVVMPWFDIYKTNKEIESLSKKLSETGIVRAIVGTGVLPEPQRQKMINSKNELVLKAITEMTAKRKVTTKLGYTLPFKKRILVFEKLIKAFNKYGIRAKVCTADNPDLVDKTSLPLCTKFKHPNFGIVE